MSFVPSMTQKTLLHELMQLFGKVEALKKRKHPKFDSDTADFVITSSVTMVMQYIDENYTQQQRPFPGVNAKEYADLALYIREILRYISMALFKNEEGLKRTLVQVRHTGEKEMEDFILRSANQTRLHYIRQFVQVLSVTGVIPEGRIIQPMTESLLSYFLEKKKRAEQHTAEDRELLNQYRLLCKNAFDKLMSLRVFAAEFPEALSSTDRLDGVEIARALGDEMIEEELSRGIFLLSPPAGYEGSS